MTGQVRWAAAALLALLPEALAASPQQPPASPARAIDESDRVVLKRNVHRLARPDLDKGRSDPRLPMDRIILTLSPRPGAQRELDQLLARQLDPASSDYHHWLTPEEFGARFGPSDEEIQLVTGWLTDHGFRIDEVGKGRGWINFSGTARQVEAAFATEMHDYQVDGKLHHANAIDPSLPRALSNVVSGVLSLNSFPKRHRQSGNFRPIEQGTTPNFTCAPNSSCPGEHFMGPADFATIYNVDPLYSVGIDGTGRTIAIVGRTDINVSDVRTFRSFFGLPAKDPVFVHNGTDPGNLGGGEELEANLDVQWSGAVAKGATIKFVISKTTNTTDGVDLSAQYIVNHNLADAMSTSFGLCEVAMGQTGRDFYANLWQQAAAQGITSFVSSGDSGAAGCDDPNFAPATGGRAVSGLCSTPSNVCVGGSQFDDTGSPSSFWSSTNDPTTQASALSYIPEIAWNESGPSLGLWSSGGGASAFYTKPSWQSAPGVPADGKRDVPDVSLAAAQHDGYIIQVASQGGLLGGIGGTSASSPSFAGLMALVVQKTGQRLGNANSTFYTMGKNQYGGGGATVFHDVTVGNNSVPGVSGFASGFAYDQVTGLGSVDADALVAAFAGLPTLSVSDVSVLEGNSGTTNFGFTVTLSATSTGTVTVQYATANGTATAGSDYVAQSGTLTFAPGQTTKTVNVAVIGDTVFEADETFFFNLGNPSNALISDGQGKGTILNDDGMPSVSINDVSALEGNSGTKNFTFTVTLSAASGAVTTVPYSTADGTATAPSDYIAAAGTLTIPAGTASGKINVAVKGDAFVEPDETFLVNLGTPTNATVAKGQGIGTILNDDAPGTFQFSLANYTVSEAAAFATIKVTRASGNAAGASVDVAVTDGTANVGSDYNLPSTSTLTFAANQLSTTFTVPIIKDTIHEPNETVLLRLLNPQPAGAGLGVQQTAVLTIVDNDSAGKVQFSAAAYKATEGGPPVTITVRRLGGLASGVTVNYTAASGTAVSPGDFTATSGTLTFDAGITSRTFPVTIGPDDGVPEGARTVLLTLSAPGGGAVLGLPSSAVLTIGDAQPTMEFSSTAYSVKESAAAALVTVKRWGPLTGTATVAYATSDGSATAGADYKAVSGTLTFLPNVSTKTFLVPIMKDSLVEGPETVNLTLSNPVGTSFGAANPAVLTILDDDVLPRLQFSAATYTVSEASPKAVITVKRAGNMAGTVVVDYAGGGGTAVNGPTGDYNLLPGTLTFGPAQAIMTFAVPMVPDTIADGTKTALLTLGGTTLSWSNPGTPTIGGTNPATLVITDHDPTVQFTSAKYTASETLTKTNLVVRRTGSLTASATVDYALVGGTAINGSDYVLPLSGTLTFNPGAATVLLPVPLIPDKIDEPNETVIVSLSNPSAGLGLGTPEITTLTITDNDTAGKVQFGAVYYSVAENAPSVALTVTRTLATSDQATVDYQVTGGTATNGVDYTLAPGTVTFNAGEKTKTITIPIIDDGGIEPNATVVVTLSNPGGGLALGTLSQTTLWIVEP